MTIINRLSSCLNIPEFAEREFRIASSTRWTPLASDGLGVCCPSLCYDRVVDVERTIEFILQTQAKTEVRVDAIAKLMQQGVRMLVKADAKLTKLSERTDRKFAELAEAQKRTNASLATLARAQEDLTRAQEDLTRAQEDLTRAQGDLARTQGDLARTQGDLARTQEELARAEKRSEARLADLAEAQRATERSLKAFLDSFRHRRNGDNPRKS